MKKTLATLAALMFVAFASPVDATHSAECQPHIQYIPADSEETSYPVYVTVDELNSGDYLFSIWIYAESNGQTGIQRDDDYCYTEGYDTSSSDTIIF